MAVLHNMISQTADSQIGMDNHRSLWKITNDYVSNESLDVSLYISQDMLLNELLSGWWFKYFMWFIPVYANI